MTAQIVWTVYRMSLDEEGGDTQIVQDLRTFVDKAGAAAQEAAWRVEWKDFSDMTYGQFRTEVQSGPGLDITIDAENDRNSSRHDREMSKLVDILSEQNTALRLHVAKVSRMGPALNNQGRANRARAALEAYDREGDRDSSDGMTDMLTDMRHLAMIDGLSFSRSSSRSFDQFLTERLEGEYFGAGVSEPKNLPPAKLVD